MANKGKEQKEFSYEGKGAKGQNVSGSVKANSAAMARAILKAQDIRVTKLTEGAHKDKASGKVKAADISLFMRQLATMLTAGIPVVQSLQVTIDGIDKSGMVKLLNKIKAEVESGLALSEAFRKYPTYFDELVCNLTAAGEQAGTLDTMLDRIALYKEKSESLKRKIKKAMYYPITVLVIAGIVTTILLLKVVPTFKDLFSGFGADLPAFTLFVLGISATIQEHGIKILIAAAVCGYLFIHAYKKQPNLRNNIQRAMLKVPIFGSIMKKAIVARFARTLATTFAAGVPLTDALTSVAKASGNIVFHNAIISIRDNVSAGQPMNTAMQHSGIFPSMVVQMVAIGEESGTLEEMLSKVAVIFEEEVDTAVDGLTTLLEPMIMLILGVVVGGLVVAMYLPIFKLGSVI